MKGPPSLSRTRPNWTLRIIGLLLVLGCLAATPWVWKQTKVALPKFKDTKGAALKIRLKTVTPLAGEYVGVLVGLVVGALLVRRSRSRGGPGDLTPAAPLAAAPEIKPAAPKIPRPTKKSWHSCNILDASTDINHLWKFEVGGGKLKLEREQSTLSNEPLPSHLVKQSWHSIWQPRLNVAWLPAESVFLRVIHLPQASPEETLGMVELQLEKLSPIPVTQVVWSATRIGNPASPEALQTMVVVLVERKVVEEFLGRLEGRGFLADRLELPVLDQLETVEPNRSGAWIYPGAWSGTNNALVAWWYDGTLQNINFVTLPDTEDRMAGFREQLTQMAWAGELEGWLTSPPAWHLVADTATAAEWEDSLRKRLGEPVETFLSLDPTELAARTAKRAASPDAPVGLMPPEFAVRYRQQFVDRMWIRALMAAGAAWVLFVVIYLTAAALLDFRTQKVEQRAAETSITYTNTILLKAKLQVLKERQELKYAALDCWQAVAETMPEILTLEGLTLSDGHRLTLNGTAPSDQSTKVTDFNLALRKWTVNGVPLFDPNGGDTPGLNATPNSPTLSWRFALELKRVEASE